MEKSKKGSKITEKTATTKKESKSVKTSSKKPAALKTNKQVVLEEAEVKPAVVEEKAHINEKKEVCLNQELNIIIGLFSLLTIISFCFAFQGGETEILGWELFVTAKNYSGVFMGVMVLYVISIFIDCAMAVIVESENEIFNTIEKVLYAITLIMNVVIIAILISLIKNIGIGLIIFLIISIVSAIMKLVRIYAKK